MISTHILALIIAVCNVPTGTAFGAKGEQKKCLVKLLNCVSESKNTFMEDSFKNCVKKGDF